LTSEYKRSPDKAGPFGRHFGRAVDRSIVGMYNVTQDLKHVKDARSVSFRSELFTSDILTILSSETFSRKYEKLPNIVVHACKNITEKCIC